MSAPTRQERQRQLDPVKTWSILYAPREATDSHPFRIAEAQTGVGKRVAVVIPIPAINAAIGGHVEIAGDDRRLR